MTVLIILIELDSTDCPQQYDFAYADQKKRRDLGIAILPTMMVPGIESQSRNKFYRTKTLPGLANMAFLKHDVIIQATEMSCGARAMAGASLGLKNNSIIRALGSRMIQ